MSVLRPVLLKKAITDLSPQELQALGVTGLLLDVDNTLTAHDSQILSPEIRAWLSDMQAAGFVLTIVSNGKAQRVRPFAEKIGLSFTALAAKPLPFGFWRAARRMGLERRRCAVIGDQIFTDLIGGKLAGMRVVQLRPIAPETGRPFLKFKRRLEKRIMKHWPQTEEW